MPDVKWNQIGALNKQLVVDLQNGNTTSGGYSVTKEPPDGWLHGSFEYDIVGYGLYGYIQKKRLGSQWTAVKYYCFNSDGSIDMKKRIVHAFKQGTGTTRTDHHFYRLIHTGGDARTRTNDYQSCEEITDIGTS